MTEGIDVDIPAAWHPDPLGRYEYRYWDGQRWTEHVANQGVAGVDATGLEPPAAAQQTGGWAATAEQQPGGGQPATGWQQDTVQQAQEAQQPADSPAPGPALEPEAGAADLGGHAPTADDADHWQQPWTAEASAPEAHAAGQQDDPTDWQRPWTDEPAAAPAASLDEAEPAGQVQPATGPAPDEEALPHWQQPWEASAPEGEVHDTPAAAAVPSEAQPEGEPEPDAGAAPWSAAPGEADPGVAGPDLDEGAEDTGLAPAPATVEEASEEDGATAAEEVGIPGGSAHDVPAEAPGEPAADERPHWQQPWTSSSLST